MEGVAPRVRLDVLDHVVLADETFRANLTHERFLAGMKTHVSPQVGLVVELFRAERTLVRLVTCVLLLVLVEELCVREPLAAQVAFKGLITLVEGVVVLRQVANSIEGFVTQGTLEDASCSTNVARCRCNDAAKVVPLWTTFGLALSCGGESRHGYRRHRLGLD